MAFHQGDAAVGKDLVTSLGDRAVGALDHQFGLDALGALLVDLTFQRRRHQNVAGQTPELRDRKSVV